MDYIATFEDNQSTADAIGRCYLATGDENYFFTYLHQDLAQVDQKLRDFVKQYLRPWVMNEGVVLPFAE